MDGNQENFEFTDPETGEVFPLNATSLVSNVRDVLLSRRRQQTEATVWKKLTEAQQQDEITAMQELARTLVGAVVTRVAEKGMTCAHVEVSKFAVDVEKGEVTITSKGFASDEMLSDLAHAKGKTAKLTVVDERQFNEKSTMVKPDADQPSLLPDDEDPDAGDQTDAADEPTADEQAAQLDDSDGLHDEVPADEPEVDPAPDEKVAGYHARMQGQPSSSNPHEDMTSTEREEWYLGWKEADAKDDAPDIVEPQPDPEPEKADTETAEADSATDQGDTAPDDGDFDPQPFKVQGLEAAANGAGPDDNPFDGGTDEYIAWDEGFVSGRQQIAGLRQQGYQARQDGMAPTRCTWNKGTREHGWWTEGYEQAKKDEQED